MADLLVGHLVPFSNHVQEDASIPKIPLSRGRNSIGRNSAPSLTDKRLSRNHLSLSADASSADLVVEGSNPVVVTSGNDRKKLYHKESMTIRDGDIIELIPGQYIFQYRKLCGDSYEKSSNGEEKAEESSRKRSHQLECGENGSNLKRFKGEVEGKSDDGGGRVEAIRHFRVPKDKLPQTFRLLNVQGLPPWANTSCVSIKDVIQGDILFAVLSNYMVDLDWLIPACPTVAKIPHVLVVHGEGDGTLDYMKRKKPANWILHKPPLPISFGTHHSKAMLLVYPRGVRIIVHTANLIFVDWNNKSQGLWMQDFPWKDQSNPSKGCGFEHDLIDYLSALKWPEFSVNLPTLGTFNINPGFFKKFDYSSAAVRLIASVPGYHTGNNMKKWGHMKLRTVLQECTFDKEFRKSPLAYQFSSLGSLDEKWMAELAHSMSSGFSDDKTPLGPGEPRIIWPTVEDVRCSIEGYAAGNAVPSPAKNVDKDFLKKYWARWKASHTGRCRAMPHIKTFTRYSGQKLAWFLLTSANLSKAAWGALQKNNSQLMIRSYELGVLFLPYKTRSSGFSCTSNGVPSEDKSEESDNSESRRNKLVTLNWQGNRNTDSSSEVITLPVPYELPPQPYTTQDVPWSWDRRYTKKDVYGQVWPRQVQLYAAALQDS
ncbi:tyrosyl-DNA phosphodiesterase 1 isoform X1 [Rosa rugosa]|uniref:tyrosyl-DNA phosphodiesterase 1 isoform X1 n=1 Tax=Rosa rugosa TaxID=74645 RepID=UPI002B4029ED|nr:tyrosyl-DNA phosphodiesterase 1 isoform X1 [Rosa rugosa]